MKLLFVCQGSTCRSPMAAALARQFGGEAVEAVSAGIRPGLSLAAHTREVMDEIGIPIDEYHPMPLEAVQGPVDYVISLCEVIAPGQDLFPDARRLWWRTPDPIGGSVESYRATRDLIWERLRHLLIRVADCHDLPVHLSELQPPSVEPFESHLAP